MLDAKISALAEASGWSYQDTVATLATAAVKQVASTRRMIEEVKADVSIPFAARPRQDVFYKNIAASLAAKRICLAEASTGLGKSRAMVAAAIMAALQNKCPVVIAAPTLAILGGSLWAEYEALSASGLGRTVTARFFPGASEFVDHEKLREYLQGSLLLEEDYDQAVADWVAQGGPNLVDTPLTNALKKSGKPLCWLMSDLRALATQLDPNEFRVITTKSSDEAKALYAALRADAGAAQIIFCTHAMLAIAHSHFWSWFPTPAVLMVDEAHLFEATVSEIHSDRLSLFSLRHHVRVTKKAAGHGPSSAAGKLESIVTEIIQLLKSLDSGEAKGIKLSPSSSEAPTLKALFDKASVQIASRTLAKTTRIAEARQAIAAVRELLSGKVNTYGRVDYSPDRRFPGILIGKRSVAGVMSDLWRDVKGGIVLASASLSTLDQFGNSKFDYMADVLYLPTARLDSPPPIIAPWLRKIPTLYTPRAAAGLSRPCAAERTDETELKWLKNLAKAVTHAAKGAKGGTMVLLTSYTQISVLGELLEALPDNLVTTDKNESPQSRIIRQMPDEKFVVCEQRFRASHNIGQRPILLALGVAWTGVDLTDKAVPPEKDFLLSDLIIGCLPIGLNRSSTMARRVELQGVLPIIKEALMTLTQGLGRAVRSERSAPKNIWVMDGRIWSAWNGMASFQQSARRMLERYEKRKDF